MGERAMPATHPRQLCEIGMVGLGVMGRNLLLNMADHGHSVAGYDKDGAKVAALRQEAAAPAGLLVDYHLDHGDGITAIAELRRTYGTGLPAILVTADRSASVREAAHAHDIQVVNKPL